MKRKEVIAKTIKQDNDAGCFNSSSNDQKGSIHNKRAKRRASKRLRTILKADQNELEKEIN